MQTSKDGVEAGAESPLHIGQYANRDAELIRRALEGQSEAFSELLTPHFKSLKNAVRRLVRNDFDAEDIVQQAMMKAYTHLDQFRFRASFRTWITAIAINEIRQNGRKRSTTGLVLDGGKFGESVMSDGGESPHELYEREQRAQSLRNAIDKLPLKYRLVIEVFYLNETSLSDSQSALRISETAAKTRLFRARRRLRVILKKSMKPPGNVRLKKTLA